MESRTQPSKSAPTEYEDLLPVMAEKLDVDTFVSELCAGFNLLADQETGVITPSSLMKNSGVLGMESMSKKDVEDMVREGDLDGDGTLNQTEFCILMVRLSPGMMEEAETWLNKALQQELPIPTTATATATAAATTGHQSSSC